MWIDAVLSERTNSGVYTIAEHVSVLFQFEVTITNDNDTTRDDVAN